MKTLIHLALSPKTIDTTSASASSIHHSGGRTITVTKNETLTALNKPDDFFLAIVQVDGDQVSEPAYIRRPFQREPDFGVTSMNYALAELLGRMATS